MRIHFGSLNHPLRSRHREHRDIIFFHGRETTPAKRTLPLRGRKAKIVLLPCVGLNWKFSPQCLSFFVRPLFLAGEQKKSILCALCVSVVNPILKRARTSSVIVVGFINRLG